MNRKPVFILVALVSLLGQAWSASAEAYSDPVFGFDIQAPDRWQTSASARDHARIYEMVSPGGAAIAQVEAIHLSRRDTLNDLRKTFISTAFPKAILAGSQPEVQGTLHGEVAAWAVDVDGQQMIVGGFFAIDGPVGYVLWAKTSRADFAAFSPQIDAIFKTFSPGTLVQAYADDVPQTKPGENFNQSDLFDGLVAEAHPELGFVFVRYDAWQPDQPAPYSLRVGLMEYPPQMRPSVVIEALSGSAYPSLQAGAEDLKSQLRTSPGIQFDQDGSHQVPNMSEDGVMMDGWSFGASYLLGDVPFRQLTFLFKRKSPSVYYTIYVTGPSEILMQHQPEMFRMLQAIQIVPFQ